MKLQPFLLNPKPLHSETTLVLLEPANAGDIEPAVSAALSISDTKTSRALRFKVQGWGLGSGYVLTHWEQPN